MARRRSRSRRSFLRLLRAQPIRLARLEAEGGAALQFELEANNFNLDDRGSYFDDGWVAEDDGAPGFFENLMSGGKLQREWDQKRKSGK